MVVFKCIILFLGVVFIQGIVCKPADYDDQTEASGIGSTLWGWITYLNPWGSAANITAIKQDIKSLQTENILVVEARQLTEVTIPVKPTAALISAPDQYLEDKVTTKSTPVISVQISTYAEKPMTKPGSTIAFNSAKNNARKNNSTEYSWEPNASTTPIASAQDIPITSEEPATHALLEPEASTTPVSTDHDIPTSTENISAYQALEPDVTNVPDLYTLITPEGPKKLIESESLIREKVLNSPEVEESTTDYLLKTTTEELTTEHQYGLESLTTTSALNDQITEVSAIDDTLKLKAVTILIVEDKNKNIEKSKTKQAFKQEKNTEEAVSTLATDIDEAVFSELYEANVKTEKSSISTEPTGVNAESVLIEPNQFPYLELAVAVPGRDEDFAKSGEVPILTKPATEPYLGAVVVFLGDEKRSTETTETSALTESALDPYQGLPVAVSEIDEQIRESSRASTLTELIMYSYPGVAVAVSEKRDEVTTEGNVVSVMTEPAYVSNPGVTIAVIGRNEVSSEKRDVSILAHPALDPYAGIHVALLGTEEESTEKTEPSTLIEFSTNLVISGNPELAFAVSERDDESTKANAWSILTEPSADLYKEVDEVPALTTTEPGLNSFLETEGAIKDGERKEVYIKTNAVFSEINEAMPTENDDRVTAPRVSRSRSHSAGIRLSFDHFRIMFLFYAVYFLTT